MGRVEAWVDAAREGDRRALSKLLARSAPALRRRLGRRMSAALRSQLDPEDILQQVYIAAFRHVDRFEDRGPGSFLGWLITILDHKLVDAQRTAHRRRRDVDRAARGTGADAAEHGLVDGVRPETAPPGIAVPEQEAIAALLGCLARLTPAQRSVLQLRYLDDRTLAETAAHLGRSKGAVVALTRRALTSLRHRMDRAGEFS